MSNKSQNRVQENLRELRSIANVEKKGANGRELPPSVVQFRSSINRLEETLNNEGLLTELIRDIFRDNRLFVLSQKDDEAKEKKYDDSACYYIWQEISEIMTGIVNDLEAELDTIR